MSDPGSPHTHPDDYPKLGLDFERDNAAVSEKQSKGPHDERLSSEICRKLEAHQFVEASRITVVAHDGAVTLDGVVGNRYARERAEQLTREIDGVQAVENRIHVQSPEEAVGGPVLSVQDPEGTDQRSTQRS